MQPTTQEAPQRKIQILIADDDPVGRKLLAQILTMDGYGVVEVGDGVEALAFCEQVRPDLVILDCLMPNMDGFDACAQLHSLPRSRNIPVLMVTALDDPNSIRRTQEAGAVDHIVKPVDPNSFRQRVRNALLMAQTNHANNGEDLSSTLHRAAEMTQAFQAERATRKRAEAALQQTEAEFRRLFMDYPHPMWIYDAETLAFLDVNDSTVKRYGYSHDEFMRLQIIDIMAPGDLLHFGMAADPHDRTGMAEARETRHQLKNGDVIEVEVTSHLIVFAEREAIFVQAQDITERKRAEAALNNQLYVTAQQELTQRKLAEESLKQSEARYRQLFDQINDAILIHDVEGHIMDVNQVACRRLGYTRNEMLQMTTAEIDAPEYAAHMAVCLQQLLSEGRSNNIQSAHRTRNGDQIIVDVDATVISYAGQKAILSVCRDVTQARLAEMALYRSEEQLRRITDNMLDIICQTDMDGNVEYASPSCWNVLGYQADDLIGHSIYDNVHPDDVDWMREAILTTGRVVYRYRHADGKYVWLETLSNLLLDEHSEIKSIIYASRDINERKQAEHELQELNRLKTEFLSTAAHELRTPLTTIRGFSELLLTRQLDEGRQHRYITLINEQSTHLGKIIDDLLDVSRLEAKRRLTLTLEPVNMADLIAEAVEPFAASVTSHCIVVKPLADAPAVLGDWQRLSQVINNLLSNAVKYSPNGGTITLQERLISNALEISVADEGMGMTPEQQIHLFEKFYRADMSNTAITGTGLGLAISKLIVELHNGTIWAESDPGAGSTFKFTIPLAPNLE
ncbi:MAG TPA: PAS domain S-box protein, partial [Aggregatilineales bacterium]|nr:PAS domain S-box protein [Aggregatilineales bacterium]